MKTIYILFLMTIVGCQQKPPGSKEIIGSEAFLLEFVPENQMVHGGVFTPDQEDYYFTISDIEFSTFTVMHTSRLGNEWEKPDTAFFNSKFNEHGVHFTPDGQQLYFSSTRPVESDTIADTWHIWRSEKQNEKWSQPEFVNIPGLDQRLVSHPTSTNSGRLYFHSGNTDYSELSLYFADQQDGIFSDPVKLELPSNFNTNCITPFVSPDETYLIFGKLIDRKEELYITYRSDDGWGECTRLNDEINTNNLGNPYVTLDKEYLYYASGEVSPYGLPHDWVVRRIKTEVMVP